MGRQLGSSNDVRDASLGSRALHHWLGHRCRGREWVVGITHEEALRFAKLAKPPCDLQNTETSTNCSVLGPEGATKGFIVALMKPWRDRDPVDLGDPFVALLCRTMCAPRVHDAPHAAIGMLLVIHECR